MASLAKWTFGSAGGYVEITTAPSIVVSDGTTTTTLTAAILGGLAKISGFVWDLTSATTGAAYAGLTDNLASAFAFKVGSTAYITFKSTTNAARVIFGKTLRLAPMTTVTIAANHALVVGTAGANQTQFAGNVFFLNNTSGSSKDLTIPAYSVLSDDPLVFLNGGADDVVIKDSTGSAIVTSTSGKISLVFNNGVGGLGSTLP